jgi:hypothetical protein
VPAVIDETYEAPLPQQCRHYGANGADGGASAVVPMPVDAQYQVENPRRRNRS